MNTPDTRLDNWKHTKERKLQVFFRIQKRCFSYLIGTRIPGLDDGELLVDIITLQTHFIKEVKLIPKLYYDCQAKFFTWLVITKLKPIIKDSELIYVSV